MRVMRAIQRKAFAANPFHQTALPRPNRVDRAEGDFLRRPFGTRQQAILVSVEKVTGTNDQPADLNGNSELVRS